MTADSETPSAAEIRAREQADRDRELNRQREQKLEARAVAAQIRQLIERNTIDTKIKKASAAIDEDNDGHESDGKQTLDYNFTDDRVVQRINLPAELHRRVVSGSIAIAKLDSSYRLIPQRVAEKICERDRSSIVVLNDSNHETTSDESIEDEYAQFEVPDDLMW